MQRPTFRILLLACFLCWGWSGTLYGQLRLFNPTPQVLVDLHQTGHLYAAGEEGSFPGDYAQIPDWQSQQQPVKAVSLTGGDYWLVTKVRHDAATTDWVLEPHNSLIDQVEARIYGEDGQVQTVQSGYQSELQYMLQYGQRIQLRPDTSYRILIRFSSPYFASRPEFDLLPEVDYRKKMAIENTLVLIAFGALIALAAFNLFVFFSTGNKSQLYYALYLTTYFIAWAFVFHLPVEFFDYRNVNVHYVPFFLLPVLNTLFYLDFLKLDRNFPLLARLSRMNLVLSLVLLPSCFLAVGYAHSLATLVISIWLGLALASGILSWRNGYRPARYFVFAFVALIVPGLFILPANVGLTSDLVDNSEIFTLLGGTLDALLLAFALADRIKLLSEQKDQYLVRLNRALDLAHTDSLTALENRYAFDAYLNTYFEFGADPDDPEQQILLLIDLDGLKTINDEYGHSAGDRLLRLFADGVRKYCGAYSAAYRFGGDEFAILSRMKHEVTLRAALVQIEKDLIASGFPEAGVSYGIAYASECRLPVSLFNISDTRMYQHKSSRREPGNLVVSP